MLCLFLGVMSIIGIWEGKKEHRKWIEIFPFVISVLFAIYATLWGVPNMSAPGEEDKYVTCLFRIETVDYLENKDARLIVFPDHCEYSMPSEVITKSREPEMVIKSIPIEKVAEISFEGGNFLYEIEEKRNFWIAFDLFPEKYYRFEVAEENVVYQEK